MPFAATLECKGGSGPTSRAPADSSFFQREGPIPTLSGGLRFQESSSPPKLHSLYVLQLCGTEMPAFSKQPSLRPFSTESACPPALGSLGVPSCRHVLDIQQRVFCSEPALLPKAEINQSWLRLSRNKSRPVQNWSLPSQNVIAWLSLRIN